MYIYIYTLYTCLFIILPVTLFALLACVCVRVGALVGLLIVLKPYGRRLKILPLAFHLAGVRHGVRVKVLRVGDSETRKL